PGQYGHDDVDLPGVGDDARGIDAYAIEGHVRQRKLAGLSQDDVQTQRQDDVDHQQIDDEQHIAAGQPRQGRPHGPAQQQKNLVGVYLHTFLTCNRPPKMPCGCTTSTTNITRKGATTMALVDTNSPTRFSTMPMMKPPATAPGMLVMPPTMAAAKARM